MKEFAIGAETVDFGWAKTLTLKQRWLIVVAIWACYFTIAIIWNGVSLGGLLLCLMYSFLFIKANSAESIINNYFEQKLVFGTENLVFKSRDTIHWHIPFYRLNRIEQVKNPNSMTLVYTNDNDSYMIYGTLSTETIDEIQQEIERIKLSTQGRTNERSMGSESLILAKE